MMRSWSAILIILSSLHLSWGQTFIKEKYFDEEKTMVREFITLNASDSTLHGLYQSMYENGSLAIKGYYTNGKSDSTWIYYFENGKIKAQGKYRDGKQHGEWKYFFEHGNLKHKGKFYNDDRQGVWTFYYENESVKSTGSYANNEKEGIWNYFYEDGSLKAQAYHENGSGLYKGFYPSGKIKTEGQNIDEKSEGIWEYFYESGETEAIGHFTGGLRNGNWKYFYKSGQLAAEGNFEAGEKTGIWKYYYPDGSLSSEGKMVHDQKDGFWKLYYLGGELKGEGLYDNGTGEYVEYYASGKQKARGKVYNGKKEGKWVFFSEEGLEDGIAMYESGVGTYEGYYPDGTLKMKGRLEDGKKIGDWTLYNPDGSMAGTYKPVYEEDRPIFRTRESFEVSEQRKTTDKPEYHYRNKKIRYFNPRINEYTAYILATNPLWTLVGKLPVSLEYYIQERLGYEVEITAHSRPFYQRHVDVRPNKLHKLGAEVTLRQKFYHEDGPIGMFYFGHQLSGGYLQHTVNFLDSTFLSINPILKTRNSQETRFSYGVFIGNRWSQRAGDSGVTVDFNVGFGIGRRSFNLQRDENPQSDYIFRELNRDKIYLPIIFTLNVGFAGPKRRSTSF